MKRFAQYLFLMLLTTVLGCASHPKSTATPAQIEALDTMVSNRSIEIDAKWARPLATQSLNNISNAGLLPYGSTANRIDLSGSTSYLRVLSDHVEAKLPYYGEQQMGGPYNPNNAGIEFEGTPKDFVLEPNEKNGGYTMKFAVNQGAENFQVTAQLFPSHSCTFNIVSSHRRSIQYDGTVSEYVEE
ncbi:MAG: DUF4251 domain-containing protein [Allomuricauda sp.]